LEFTAGKEGRKRKAKGWDSKFTIKKNHGGVTTCKRVNAETLGRLKKKTFG